MTTSRLRETAGLVRYPVEKGRGRPLAVGEPPPETAGPPRREHNDDLHARPEPRAGGPRGARSTGCSRRHPVGRLWTLMRPDVLQGPAAYLGSTGIGASRVVCRPKRPVVVANGASESWVCCRMLRCFRYDAGQPIPWSNSSWAADSCTELSRIPFLWRDSH